MRNKINNKSAAEEFDDDRSCRGYYGKLEPLLNESPGRYILRGERNLWNDGDQRYPVIEKVTLSETANRYLRSSLRDTAASIP